MQSCENINIECYLKNYEKLKKVIGEYKEEIDWERFTADNFKLFDERFINEYSNYIVFDKIDQNSSFFQKNFELFRSDT